MTPGFHSGAWNTGAGGLAFLHDDEMVVPKKDADPFRSGQFWENMGGTGSETNITKVELTGLMPVSDVRDLVSELRAAGERGQLKRRKRMAPASAVGKY